METWLQWIITPLVGIVGILIGREWEKKDRKNAKDMKTLELILKIIPSDGSIEYIRQKDFGSYFDVNKLSDIADFLDKSSYPELSFINKDLEKIRHDLIKYSDQFYSELGLKSWRVEKRGMEHISRIQCPEEVGIERFNEVREYFNNLSLQVCNSYDKLIKAANRKI